MRISRKVRQKVESSAASSDLAFLLIIYFIVIAGFNINLGFILNLPARDSTRTIRRDDLLRFELDDRGSVVFQGARVEWAEAEKTIGEAALENPDLAVFLTISPLAPWQEVVSFVELAQRLNIDAFSFTIGPEPTEPGIPQETL